MAATGTGNPSLPNARQEDRQELPLRGRTVLNTRESEAAGELTRLLEAQGARVMERPMLAFAPPESWQPFDDRLARLVAGDWVVFTSAIAVHRCMDRIKALGGKEEKLREAQLAVVGPATSGALGEWGLHAALLPERTFQAEGLLETLLHHLTAGARIWLPRADSARDLLPQGLRNAGMEVSVTPVYRTVMPEGGLGEAGRALREGSLDWILFTSSSTVSHFLRMWEMEPGGGPPPWPLVACLGQVTAETARSGAIPVTVVPERQDMKGLIDAVVQYESAQYESARHELQGDPSPG